ncbi:hypothetical protein SEPCBS57363_001467 [Sporothrix epigloea]|uniref:Gag protein n=1 Tax=Sporothrix epigloea TaxID=1892477 RepID=A0ABP0DBJ7_9PEZI
MAGAEAVVSPAIADAIEGAIQRSQRAMMEQLRAIFLSAVSVQEARRDQSPGLPSFPGSSSPLHMHPDRAAGTPTGWGDQPLPNLKLEGPKRLKRSDDYRIRDQWLGAVERVLEAAPIKFNTPMTKVFYALDRLEPDLVQDFTEYAETLPEQDGEMPYHSWKVFRKWFDTAGDDSGDSRFLAMQRLDNLHQAADQCPRDFAGVLAAHERKFSPLPDAFRADLFRVRLVRWLQDELRYVANVSLLSRSALVTKAQAIWDSKGLLGQRRQRDASPGPSTARRIKRPRAVRAEHRQSFQ